MELNLPTYLTLLRIILIPVLVVVFYSPLNNAHIISAVIFTIAALTDWLDGYLARKLNMTTAFGAFLDPVADKLMVAFALVLVVQAIPDPWLTVPAAIIIGREITIASLREWMAKLGEDKKVAVSWIGKWKTTVQMIAIGALMIAIDIPSDFFVWTGFGLLYIAAALTLWSMISYLMVALPVMREK